MRKCADFNLLIRINSRYSLCLIRILFFRNLSPNLIRSGWTLSLILYNKSFFHTLKFNLLKGLK